MAIVSYSNIYKSANEQLLKTPTVQFLQAFIDG